MAIYSKEQTALERQDCYRNAYDLYASDDLIGSYEITDAQTGHLYIHAYYMAAQGTRHYTYRSPPGDKVNITRLVENLNGKVRERHIDSRMAVLLFAGVLKVTKLMMEENVIARPYYEEMAKFIMERADKHLCDYLGKERFCDEKDRPKNFINNLARISNLVFGTHFRT